MNLANKRIAKPPYTNWAYLIRLCLSKVLERIFRGLSQVYKLLFLYDFGIPAVYCRPSFILFCVEIIERLPTFLYVKMTQLAHPGATPYLIFCVAVGST